MNENVRLTKAGLITLMESYPDDAPIVVAVAQDRRDTAKYLYLDDNDPNPVAWSVGNHPDKIVLEL